MDKMTFCQLASEWLLFKKNKTKESTYLNYKFVIESKLNEELGDKTINELLNYNFNEYIERLNDYLSKKTIKDVIVILKGVLRYIEAKYDVNFRLSLIATPNSEEKEIEIFTERERRRLIRYCLKTKQLNELAVLISLYTGLRVGEVCALKWEDIDFEKRLLYVRHTVQRVYTTEKATKLIYSSPKTRCSRRVIPIATVLYEKLKEVAVNYNREDFILTGDSNKYIEPMGYRYTYKHVLRRARVKYKKYHVLRHTFATKCVNVGMDIKSLSEILGHANVNVTLKVYVHSSYKIKSKYINRL